MYGVISSIDCLKQCVSIKSHTFYSCSVQFVYFFVVCNPASLFFMPVMEQSYHSAFSVYRRVEIALLHSAFLDSMPV
jgi:hypothetical protein